MSIPEVNTNSSKILSDIQYLQQIEKELFTNLETNISLTNEEKKKIIEKINSLSKMRINLYKQLGMINGYFKDSLANSRTTLVEQTATIEIIEDELNRAKIHLRQLEEEKNNKVRLIEINNYYSDKYAEHSDLMKIIIFTLIPIIILAILNTKGFIPNTDLFQRLYYLLIIIITTIGTYYLFYRLGSIIARDSMNYQEYVWNFNAKKAPSGSGESTDPWLSLGKIGTCIGEACCSKGQKYDYKNDKCITSTKVESFINENFTKPSNMFQKPDVTLNLDVEPNNEKSFMNFSGL